VVLVDAQPVLYLERGGRSLRVLVEPHPLASAAGERPPASVGIPESASAAGEGLPASVGIPESASAAGGRPPALVACVERALLALAEHARAGRLATRIALERVDGKPVLGSPWEATLEQAGFQVGPRRAELRAS
jgi:hypothetical protein